MAVAVYTDPAPVDAASVVQRTNKSEIVELLNKVKESPGQMFSLAQGSESQALRTKFAPAKEMGVQIRVLKDKNVKDKTQFVVYGVYPKPKK